MKFKTAIVPVMVVALGVGVASASRVSHSE